MNKGLVSIIIPIYNIERYIDNCIKSACEQFYENIEIILVDDGSTDNSPQICDAWAKKDSRIIVIHKKNGGLSSARNAGLDVAKGKYVYFLDGDDTIQSNLLSVSLSKMSDDTDMVVFGYNLVYKNSENAKVKLIEKTYRLNTDEERVSCVIGPFFRFELTWNAWNRIFLKSVIDEYTLRFEDNRRIMAEDQYFCLVYLAHCKKITVIEDCLYDYYQREDSIMGTIKKNKIRNFGRKNELAVVLLEHYNQFSDCKCFIDVFPIIHYFLVEREIQILEDSKVYGINDLRSIIIEEIRNKSDFEFFTGTLKKFIIRNKVLFKEYGFLCALEKIGRAKWLLTGRSFWYTVFVKYRKGLK